MQQVSNIINLVSYRPQRHPLAPAVVALCLAAGIPALAQQVPAIPASEQTMLSAG